MNKTELVTAVAEVSGKPKADVKEVLEALMGQIIKTVKSGDEVALVGFGTFKSAKREARVVGILQQVQNLKSQLRFSRNLLQENFLKTH